MRHRSAEAIFPWRRFFILAWLTVFTVLARKIFKGRIFLTGKELLLVWILMVIVSGIAYTGLVRTFFINLTAPYHFATVENRWGEVLQPLLPSAWYPQSAKAIDTLYNGLPGGHQMGWGEVILQIPWNAWVKPLLVWSCFIFLCYFVMLCMVNILSRQALYNERMNFPLLQVPQMMEEALDKNGLEGFLTHRFFLIGLMIPLFLHLINGLNFYYPAVPQIPTLILAGSYFPGQGLFSGFHNLKIYLYPAFIGFAFLTSKQISFSFWFFFLAGALLVGLLSVLGYTIPAADLGVTFGPTLSRPDETQTIGATVIFFLFLLWLARSHFLEVIQRVFYFGKDARTEEEWFSIRISFWGVVFGSVGILLWFHYFGMPLLVAVLLLGAFFMMTLVASRVICQGGIAYFTLTAAPMDGLLAFFGPRFFTHVGLLIAGVAQKVLFVDLRESLMPSLLHARKITQGMGRQAMDHRRHHDHAGGLRGGVFSGHAVLMLQVRHPGAAARLGDPDDRGGIRQHLQPDRDAGETGQMGPHFLRGRCGGHVGAGDLLPSFILVASAPDRIPDRLQLGHADSLVQFFRRMDFQRPLHAVWRGGSVQKTPIFFCRSHRGRFSHGRNVGTDRTVWAIAPATRYCRIKGFFHVRGQGT